MTRSDWNDGARIVLATVLVSVALLSTLGTPVTARPPPQAVCGVCSDSLSDAATENGVAIDVGESTLSIRLDESGTGHWTARVTLTGTGVEALRENESLRERVVRRVFDRGYVAVEDPRSLVTSMNGSTLVVEYDVRGMAHESAGGVYVVDFFYWHGGEARWFSLAADSMTMHGPPGTVVSHVPDGASTVEDTVTWQGSDEQYDPLGVRSHVVFASDHSASSSVATTFGIGVDVAQLKAQDFVAVGAPLLILALVLVLLERFGPRAASFPPARLIGVVVGSIGTVWVIAAASETLVGAPGPLTDQLGDFLFYLLFSIVATGAGPALLLGGVLVGGQLWLLRWLLDSEGSTRAILTDDVVRPVRWSAGVFLAAQVLLFPVATGGAAGYDTTYGLASLVVPTLYFVPLVVTPQRKTLSRLAFAVGVVLAPFAVVFAFAPHTGMGLVPGALSWRYVPWALVVAAIGTLAYAAAYRLTGQGE